MKLSLPARAVQAALLAGLAFAAAAAGGPGAAQGDSMASKPVQGLDQNAAFVLSRSVIGTVPGSYVMRDQDGQALALAQFRGKPLLVNFVYSGCFEVCPTSSRALAAAVQAMSARFGAGQFNVVSIGFDQPTDSPVSLRAFAARQRIDAANWKFLSPRAEDVAALTREFGFSYAATPIGFDHTLQVTILDADGRIYRQVYGDGFGADSLGEPLKQLIAGTLLADTRSWGDLLGRVRILCSVYDPVSGEYRGDYTLFIEIAGGVTFILAMLSFALAEWRTRRKVRRAAPTCLGPSRA